MISTRSGEKICKFQSKGFYILAYATPKQYDIEKVEEERKLADISILDPLGSMESNFPHEAPQNVQLLLESSGDRVGFPVGSHCLEEVRTGSKCCSIDMFNAMNAAYNTHMASSYFNAYDIRNISKVVQWNVEEVFQHSAEVIVALDDFVYASHYNDSFTCKYRVDRYHILAYLTPDHNLDKRISEVEIPNQITPSPYWITPVPMTVHQQPMFNLQQNLLPYQLPTHFSSPFTYAFGRMKRQIGTSPVRIFLEIC